MLPGRPYAVATHPPRETEREREWEREIEDSVLLGRPTAVAAHPVTPPVLLRSDTSAVSPVMEKVALTPFHLSSCSLSTLS